MSEKWKSLALPVFYERYYPSCEASTEVMYLREIHVRGRQGEREYDRIEGEWTYDGEVVTGARFAFYYEPGFSGYVKVRTGKVVDGGSKIVWDSGFPPWVRCELRPAGSHGLPRSGRVMQSAWMPPRLLLQQSCCC